MEQFANFLSQFGWDYQITDIPFNETHFKTVRSVKFNYRFPEDDGYFPKLDVVEINYKQSENIPGFNDSLNQIYGIGRPRRPHDNSFPLIRYQSTFKWVRSDLFQEYGTWLAYRINNVVYIVYKTPTRQDIRGFFNIMVGFFKNTNGNEFSVLKKIVESKYKRDLEFFQATKTTQSSLKTNGYYNGHIDGVFGRKTKEGLQQFLYDQGYYLGEIDGVYGRNTTEALKKFQIENDLKPTGEINNETAKTFANYGISD
ncbi:MAG: peptidoglycan-binding protein [Candidatus Zixiibacteriota bacterium]